MADLREQTDVNQRTLARFAAWIEFQPDGCWYWTGPLFTSGYGCFGLGGKRRPAHCVAYEHFVRPIPVGLEVDHLCHNRDENCRTPKTCPHRRCVNPDHLEPVTHRENMLRGHTVAAANAAKTHCPHGHEYTPENTYIPPGTDSRTCRTCIRDRTKAKNARDKALRGIPNGEKTHCPQGHPYDNENTILLPSGSRRCRICRREKGREHMRARRRRIAARRVTLACA